MKKLFIITIALFGAMTTLKAQELHFGLKGGTNLSTISGDDFFVDNYRTGLYGGVYGEIVMSDKISIQPEVLYSMLGSHETNKTYTANGVASDEYTVKLRYINVPVMLKYNVYKNLNIQVGPQISFLLDSQIENEMGYAGYVNSIEQENVNEFFTDANFSANFGLGYKFNNGLFIDARYSLGLVNIAQKDQYTGEFKNHFFQFGVGYQLF